MSLGYDKEGWRDASNRESVRRAAETQADAAQIAAKIQSDGLIEAAKIQAAATRDAARAAKMTAWAAIAAALGAIGQIIVGAWK